MRFFRDFSVTDGHDEVMLFLHGFTGGPGAFTYLLPQLGCDAFSYTFKGHGPDYSHFHEATASQWLDGAGEVLMKLRKAYSRVYLAGYSMGGVVALLLSSRIPCDGLFLFAPAVCVSPPAACGPTRIEDVNQALLKLCDEEDLGILRFFLEADTSRESAELSLLQQKLLSSWKSPKAPAFAFFGSDDSVVPAAKAVPLCAGHGIECTLIEGCTHALLYGGAYEKTIAAFDGKLALLG